ncbi:hypothetical protein, partial [Micromonospora sp. CPCC 205561]|uniref:hypothetical protein n=1 Tax=Micromonospora sp. CPCC 205561 TaxID=3122407 RepID=UPI002FF008BD
MTVHGGAVDTVHSGEPADPDGPGAGLLARPASARGPGSGQVAGRPTSRAARDPTPPAGARPAG